MVIQKKVINGDCATEYRCSYGCGQDATETDISETPYATYICGDIECWNSFCFEVLLLFKANGMIVVIVNMHKRMIVAVMPL